MRLPAPEAAGEVEVSSATSSTIALTWPAFKTAGSLSLVQYRVRASMVKRGREKETEEEDIDWENSHCDAIFNVPADQQVSHTVTRLNPITEYILRVDARYPFVGDHSFCTPIDSPQVTTKDLEADQQPPMAPILVYGEPPLLGMEDQGAQRYARGEEMFLTTLKMAQSTDEVKEDDRPWLLVRLEDRALDYDLEVIDSKGAMYPPHRAVVVQETRPRLVAVWIANVIPQEGDLSYDTVCLRLRHRYPATITPQLWVGSMSVPVVPRVEKAKNVGVELHCTDEVVRLKVGFTLGMSGDRDKGPLVSRARLGKRYDNKRLEFAGHTYVTHVQVRIREEQSEPEDAEKKEKKTKQPKAEWRELEKRELPDGQADFQNGGERFDLFFGDHTGELEIGKAYSVSLRVGTATRSSLWSEPVGPVLLAFPPPKKIAGGFNVVPESMTLKCNWTSFSAPKGVFQLEYRVRATPYDFQEDSVGLASTDAYVLADSRQLTKDRLEETLYGLHPGLKYRVEIACRHPVLGRRDFLPAEGHLLEVLTTDVETEPAEEVVAYPVPVREDEDNGEGYQIKLHVEGDRRYVLAQRPAQPSCWYGEPSEAHLGDWVPLAHPALAAGTIDVDITQLEKGARHDAVELRLVAREDQLASDAAAEEKPGKKVKKL
jgi:hypothetical protein